jgi:nicotinamidase/pyrazinamidase
MKVLLIEDVQNDFLPGGALGIPEGDKIIPIINALQEIFPCVLATKDWHPLKHISFASTHGRQPGEIIEIEGLRQELWPDHCIQGSKGAEFAPSLHSGKIQKVFFKGSDSKIDSYSSFYDNAHLRSTGLGEYLQQLGCDELYIVGLATDYCVKYSVLDASRLGFKIYVIIDACKGIELKEGDIERAIAVIKEAGAHIIESSSLFSLG